MATRRRSRQRALQILFLWDARRQPVDEIIDA
jgi:transcription termination factor NusB